MPTKYILILSAALTGCNLPHDTLKAVLDTDHELEDIAGTDYVRNMLYDRLSAVSPGDRRLQAQVAARRCVLARQYTPAAAQAVCSAALSAARALDDRALIAAALRRRAQDERQAGACGAALSTYAAAAAAVPESAHIERAQIAWGQALCLSKRSAHSAAQRSINTARAEIAAAGAGAADFNAIVDLHGAEVAAAADDLSTACSLLDRALSRQTKLKSESPEYAGYAHYYARIRLAQVINGCAAQGVLAEVQGIAADLLTHDPRRADYIDLSAQVAAAQRR